MEQNTLNDESDGSSSTYAPSGITPGSEAAPLVSDVRTSSDTHEASMQSFGDSILRSIKDAVLVVNADTTIERVNPATLQLTGYTEDELVGQPIGILSKHKRLFGKILAKTITSDGNAHRLETACLRKDGSEFPVAVSASEIYDPQSATFKIVCVAQDITKRKRLEAESRVISKIIHGVTTTENLDELLELIHSSIKTLVYAENFFVALYDPETEMLTMQFWVDQFDPKPAPLKIGRSLSAYVFRQGRSMLVTDAAAKEFYANGEIENIGTDSPIWLGVPLKTPAGVIGVLVVQDYENSDTYTYQDVELLSSVADQIAIAIERKRAEEKLRVSQERFELITRATSDAIWDWNLLTNEDR